MQAIRKPLFCGVFIHPKIIARTRGEIKLLQSFIQRNPRTVLGIRALRTVLGFLWISEDYANEYRLHLRSPTFLRTLFSTSAKSSRCIVFSLQSEITCAMSFTVRLSFFFKIFKIASERSPFLFDAMEWSKLLASLASGALGVVERGTWSVERFKSMDPVIPDLKAGTSIGALRSDLWEPLRS